MSVEPTNRTLQLANLANAILSVARDIRIYGHQDPDIIEITPLETLVMNYVARSPGVSPSQICSDIGLRSSNTSAILRSLESKKMIAKIPDPNDRRSTAIHTTAIAAQNLERLRARWAHLLSQHVDDTVDLIPTVQLLDNINESLSNAGNPTPPNIEQCDAF